MALAPRKLDDRISAYGQVTEADIAEAARLGFRTIINNRPDGEEPFQLSAARAEEVARAHGLAYVFIPVNAQTLGPQAVESMARALAQQPAPVLAHCRSGMRSTVLWALATAKTGDLTVEEILHRAANAGYDLSPQRPMLEAYAAPGG